MGDENQEKLKLDVCEITPAVDQLLTAHFKNSVLNITHIYSCAVDSFLEVASCLFLPHLSNLNVINDITELLFTTCSRFVKKNLSACTFQIYSR